MKKALIVFICLSLVWMCIIFLFSSMDSNDSNGKSKEVITIIVKEIYKIGDKFGVISEELTKKDLKDVVEKLNYPLRKVMHVFEYCVLSILLINVLKFSNIVNWKIFLISIILSFVFSCTDEYHQMYVEGRTSQLLDCFIDTSGAMLGCIIYRVFSSLKNNRKLNIKS